MKRRCQVSDNERIPHSVPRFLFKELLFGLFSLIGFLTLFQSSTGIATEEKTVSSVPNPSGRRGPHESGHQWFQLAHWN